MSEKEDTKTLGDLRIYKTRSLQKNKPGFFGTPKTVLQDDLDKSCLYQFSNKFIRVEYPGHVKNIDRAIETLGGIDDIQLAIDGRKLELNFNPNNHYNKGCMAEKDTNVGVLIKLIQNNLSREYSYEILGPTNVNFKFNKMCDFQYLPLVAKIEPETEECDVEYVHDKIITNTIPSLEWFTRKETSDGPAFLISENFARFDNPQAKFKTNSTDSFVSILRPDILRTGYTNKKAKPSRAAPTIRVSFTKHPTNIPDQPLSKAMNLIKERLLQKHYLLVKTCFQERPVWRKTAIMHKTNISFDSAKFVLPCVAYYCSSGPWRSCWIRFGYDPSSDYSSRIYQVLDFRIRSNEGMTLKIRTKRGLLSSFFTGDPISNKSACELDYVFRPNHLPPARQMFYQYCDILVPEIQEMIAKLPKLPPATKYDVKNGWLPLSFQEHCREIVNRYIFETVQRENLKASQMQSTTETVDNISSYCSKMLSNIKKGVHQSIGQYSGRNTVIQENIIEEINLSDDEEEVDANEIINSLPERIPENFEDDDEDDDDESDLEIDLEAVEEVNEIVSGIKDQKL